MYQAPILRFYDWQFTANFGLILAAYNQKYPDCSQMKECMP